MTPFWHLFVSIYTISTNQNSGSTRKVVTPEKWEQPHAIELDMRKWKCPRAKIITCTPEGDTKRDIIALQVVTTSLYGPRPRFSPLPPLYLSLIDEHFLVYVHHDDLPLPATYATAMSFCVSEFLMGLMRENQSKRKMSETEKASQLLPFHQWQTCETNPVLP